MYHKHQTAVKGDMSFMDSLLPSSVLVQHMDSYNKDDKRRFQGSFMYNFGATCNDAPLAILKIATKYKTSICTQCGQTPHIIWTIWFD